MNDVEEALTMQRNMRQLLLKGSFNLTKWCSNEITVCQKLPQDLLAKPIEKLFHHENTERILGVKWSPFEDSIGIQISKFDYFEGTVWTQRKALSLVSKTFDPFGSISTFTITMKIEVQDNWKNGQMWDKPLEEAAEQTLTRTLGDMPRLRNSTIYRINTKQERPTPHFLRCLKSSNSSIRLFTNHRCLWKNKMSFHPRKNTCSPHKTTNDPQAGNSSFCL